MCICLENKNFQFKRFKTAIGKEHSSLYSKANLHRRKIVGRAGVPKDKTCSNNPLDWEK